MPICHTLTPAETHSPPPESSTTLRVSSLLLLIAAFVFAYNTIALLIPMVTSSLWNDEFYSVVHFAAKGPLHVMTDYHVPNNHIFFNLLNSLFPENASLSPLRARLVSLISIGVILLTIFSLTRRTQTMWQGAILFTLVSSPPFLELLMQARGYGLLALCSLMHCLLTQEFVRQPKYPSLACIACISFIGTWTVPSYLFFAATLHICIFLYRRDLKTFLAGTVAATCIGLAYAPVFTELVQASSGYRAEHGVQFPEFASLGVLATDYLRIQSGWYQIVLGIFPLACMFWMREKNSWTYRILLASCLGAFATIVLLQTPLPRTVAYLLIPAMFITGAGMQSLWISIAPYPRTTGSLAILLVACTLFVHYRHEPRYVPIENWQGVAQALNDSFPGKMKVFAPFRFRQLKPYLSDRFEAVRSFEEESFLAGNLVAIENKYSKSPFVVLPTQAANLRSITIPQQRGGMQVIHWIADDLPTHAHLTSEQQ